MLRYAETPTSLSAMAWKITVPPNIPEFLPPYDSGPQTPPYPNFPAEIKACFGKIVDLSK